VYTIAGASYDYTKNSDYTLEIECQDGDDIVTEDLIVYLEPNAVPVIQNLPGTVYSVFRYNGDSLYR